MTLSLSSPCEIDQPNSTQQDQARIVSLEKQLAAAHAGGKEVQSYISMFISVLIFKFSILYRDFFDAMEINKKNCLIAFCYCA